MNLLAVASTPADARAAAAMEQHHAELTGALAVSVDTVLEAAAVGVDEARVAISNLVDWCRTQLIPHALAEEPTLYAAAAALAEGRLLAEGMRAEHAVIVGLVDELAGGPGHPRPTPLAGAAAARALRVIFESHVEKENDLLLPLLVAAREVSVADLLAGMHDLIGGRAQVDEAAPGAAHHGEHACACGEADGADYPVLDAAAIPHAIRHATIFGALDVIRPGGGLILVAPHDPKPLLAQLEQRSPGVFCVEYLDAGPDVWRLAFVRQAV